jgi:hypothetical protein
MELTPTGVPSTVRYVRWALSVGEMSPSCWPCWVNLRRRDYLLLVILASCLTSSCLSPEERREMKKRDDSYPWNHPEPWEEKQQGLHMNDTWSFP